MSALIRESHANETQPCWVPADSTSGLYPTPFDLTLGGPISAGCPIFPTAPQILTLTPYATTAGKYYDIAITARVDVIGGTPTGIDQARIFISVDPAPITPPATSGEWADDIRIGATTTTYITKFVRLLCNVNAQVSIGIQGFQIGTSTATYSSSWVNLTVSEVP